MNVPSIKINISCQSNCFKCLPRKINFCCTKKKSPPSPTSSEKDEKKAEEEVQLMHKTQETALQALKEPNQ